MQELLSLNADDGLMDRFLFFPVRPMFNQTQLIKEGIEIKRVPTCRPVGIDF